MALLANAPEEPEEADPDEECLTDDEEKREADPEALPPKDEEPADAEP